MSYLKLSSLSGMSLFCFVLIAVPLHSKPLTPTQEVQANIEMLLESKSCPQCDLRGSDLSRMDLSGANLQGANLSRARLFLTDLSEANLQNCDLREAVFGGADLANADLRGADMTGASLAGAYLSGTLLDGELVTTTPYAKDQISDVEETVYVDDTVKPKSLPETENVAITPRRDFEETPPVLPEPQTTIQPPAEVEVVVPEESPLPAKEVEVADASIPDSSIAAPASKAVPTIGQVNIEEETVVPTLILAEEKKKMSPQEEGSLDSGDVEKSVVQSSPAPVEEVEVHVAEVDRVFEEEGVDTAVAEVEMDTDAAPAAKAEEAEESGLDKVESVDEPEVIAEVIEPESQLEAGEAGEPDSQPAMEETVETFTEVSVTGPSPEVLKNIETLLDTNRCYGCNLAGADLSGKNLDEADLEGADLRNCNLSKVDLEEANLKGANLSGANLSDADLSEADLYRAVLTGADLTGANLEGSLLDEADLSGAKGYQQNILLIEEQ